MKWEIIYLLCLINCNALLTGALAEKEEDKELKIGIEEEDRMLMTYPPYKALAEIQIYKIIKRFSQHHQIEAIDKYILDFEEVGLDLKSDLNGALEWTKNPLVLYRMTRRFVKEFKSVEKILQVFNETESLEEFKKLEEMTDRFPDSVDLSEVIYSLLNMQDYHDLKAKKLARGQLYQIETGVKLNGRHCFEIAEFALENEFYTLSLDWLEAAEEMMDLNIKEIHELRAQIFIKHDQNWEENHKINHQFIFKTKLKSLNINSLEESQKNWNKELLWNKYVGNFTTKLGQQMDFNYMALCKGTKLRTLKQEKSLYCWLDTKRGAYWRINPLKIELLNKFPYLILIHKALSDNWTQQFVQRGYDRITTVYDRINPKDFSNITIYKRYELLFNFTAKNILKINIYAPGSMLHPHVDTGGNSEKIDITKDQIMTSSVFYMTDVEIGGETVFPYIGVSVKPSKGSVLMWHNTLRNGEWNRRMTHGGCPVVFGHKWVAYALIMSSKNFLRRPCLLDKTK